MIDTIKTTERPTRDRVLLVHGLAATRAMLRPLQGSLELAGYDTVNWGYRSVLGEIEGLSQRLADQLQKLEEDADGGRLHVVAHSMGAILVRAALARRHYPRLHRIVMLGPPHNGSRVATNLSKVLGLVCRPLKQLSDQPDSLVNNLPVPSGYPIGIIAASRDRVVRVESTMLPCQSDHIVVESGHTSMLYRKEVAELVAGFLEQGHFARQPLRLAGAN